MIAQSCCEEVLDSVISQDLRVGTGEGIVDGLIEITYTAYILEDGNPNTVSYNKNFKR